MGQSIRFIIINVTPAELSATLRTAMERLGAVGACETALAYPPHVTLRTGAIVPEDEIDPWLAGFSAHVAGLAPARVQTSGFTHTTYESGGESRHFFGYTIEPTAPLVAVHRHLLDWEPYRKSDQSSWWPHLSIAYHDVTDEGAARIADELAREPGLLPPELSWECDTVGIYHEAGGRWVEWTSLSLP